jgi:hypothetical protein
VAPAPVTLSVTPAALSFGTVQRFALALKAVTLTNTGGTPVTLSRASVTPATGTSRTTFTAVSLCGSSLAPGKSCAVGVLMFADTVGTMSATLNIPNNASGAPQAVPLSVVVTPRTH